MKSTEESKENTIHQKGISFEKCRWVSFWLSSLFIFFAIPMGFGQQYDFKNIGVENGLSHNTVFVIYQDADGFMWFGTKDGLNRYDGSRFKVFKNNPNDPHSLGNNNVQSLYQDSTGDIWVGTNNGLFIYHPSAESFDEFEIPDQNGNKIWGQILEIREDLQGNIWVASSSSGVYRFQPSSKKLDHFHHDPNKKGSLASGPVSSMTIDEKGTVWVGVLGGGIQKFIPANGTFHEYLDPDSNLRKDQILVLFDHGQEILIGTKNGGLKKLSKLTGQIENVLIKDNENNSLFVRNIGKYDTHQIWICTERGIYLYDFTSGEYRHLYQNDSDPYSLSDNAIYSIYQDKEGGIWLGTYFAGLNYLPNHTTVFNKFYPVINENSISGKRVREIVEDKNGRIWIGTEDKGLSQFDTKTRQFINFVPEKNRNSLSYHNIHGLLISKNELWISSHSQGLKLDILDLEDLRFRSLDQTHLQNPLFDSDIFSITEDRAGNKWFGTISGAYKLAKGAKNFEFVKAVGINFFHDIIEDHLGYLWFATTNNGLFRYHPERGNVKHFYPDKSVEGALPGAAIVNLFEDSKNRLWIGTEGFGLCFYEPASESFKIYNTATGLPSNTIYKILEDDLNYLWISTGNGLVRMLPEDGDLEVFTKSNGLLSDQFNYKSGLKSHDGTLYFGSLNGFVSFDPKTFTLRTIQPEIRLTGIKLFNQDIPIGQKGSPLKQSITNTKSIKLKHSQSSISLTFAALGYTLSDSWKYAYIMEGLEKDWNEIERNQEVSYLNLTPGKYNFRVKAIHSDNQLSEGEASLEIIISPPFYFSPLAYFIYTVIVIMILLWLINAYKKRVSNRHLENIRLLEDEKQKEIYKAKIEFFTNITHEIRTPLTLIKGPLEVILQKKDNLNESVLENLLIMERNSNRLISLSNQLLDFRKTEKRSYKLNFVTTDIQQLILDLQYRFKPMAIQNNLEFEFEIESGKILVDIDKEEVTKILSNLLSNALKNADKLVSIHLNAGVKDNPDFEITICNDGKIIEESHQEKIFEPFYQINHEDQSRPKQGTGLGLPLSRSLAQMHSGDLFFNPAFRDGFNCFTLRLPKIQKEAIRLSEVMDVEDYLISNDQLEEEDKVTAKENGKPGILLVEDNKELQKFMSGNLKQDYHIYKAGNGQQALEVLDSKPVDLIVSDIMMPIMDGMRLCQEVKSKLEYSHIPVILLTAKSNLQSKIEGLEMGADVYIEKPFSLEYLMLQVKNLLHYRDQVRKNFANSPNSLPDTIAHTKADEIFLHQANKLIQTNLSNELFGVNELAENLNMSQSSLLRKIKGIAKMTPNEYIRIVRLKKAAEILNSGSYSISEVATMVGFNSPGYFSKCFVKQFGELPRDYQKLESE